jgi:hypothetical protein
MWRCPAPTHELPWEVVPALLVPGRTGGSSSTVADVHGRRLHQADLGGPPVIETVLVWLR